MHPCPRPEPPRARPAARVEPLAPDWRAFLVTRDAPQPLGLLWWSRSRVNEGWLYELAGEGAINADALLPTGDRLEVADHVRGMRRIAVRSAAGTLSAALYVTRSGELPKRDWVAAQLGEHQAAPAELLAGRPRMPQADRGPLVCICHGVGEKAITAAACAGAATVEAVGTATRAGTNCGSCRPAIARLLEAALADVREAAE